MRRVMGLFALVLALQFSPAAHGSHWAHVYRCETDALSEFFTWCCQQRYSSVEATSDGGYIAAGQTRYIHWCYWRVPLTDERRARQFLVTKLDEDGIVSWQVVYPHELIVKELTKYPHTDPESEPVPSYAATCVQEVPDGYVVAGCTYTGGTAYPGLDEAGLVLKLDSAGSLVWQAAFAGAGHRTRPYSMIASDTEVILVGQTATTKGGSRDFWVAALDPSDGQITWEKTYDSGMDDWAVDVTRTADGGLAVVGTSKKLPTPDDPGDCGVWVLKLNSGGDVYEPGGSRFFDHEISNERAGSIVEASDGTFVVVGDIGPTVNSPCEILALEFALPDSQAQLYEWAKSYWFPGAGVLSGVADVLHVVPTREELAAELIPIPWEKQPRARAASICKLPDGSYMVAGSITERWGHIGGCEASIAGIPVPRQHALLLGMKPDGDDFLGALYGRERDDEFSCVRSVGAGQSGALGDILVCGYSESDGLWGSWVMRLTQGGVTEGDMSCIYFPLDPTVSDVNLDYLNTEVTTQLLTAAVVTPDHQIADHISHTIPLCEGFNAGLP